MDMSGMDMSGGGGMDMSSEGLFTETNKGVAHMYWYIIAACVAFLGLIRLIDAGRANYEKRLLQRHPHILPCRPRNRLSQAYATATAMARELAAPQPVLFTGRFSRYFTPPSLGRCLVLLAYWGMLLTMLWSDVIIPKSDIYMYAYKWEKVAFRAAWVSVTQLPFVYLLSCKFNPVSLLTGVSYERLNWLHRWAARTVFLTVIVHWSFFFREWWLADFVQFELAIMPMVKYGFGAWAVIGWMVLSGFGFFRQANHEIFVLQHIAAAAVLLWLVHVHVPSYAAYNVWMAVGFLAFDWGARLARGLYVNIRRNRQRSRGLTVGYDAHLEALPGDVTKVTIPEVNFTWTPGQHVFLSVPRMGMGVVESHPFTIANDMHVGTINNNTIDNAHHHRTITLYAAAHSGFTRRLLDRALRPSTTLDGTPPPPTRVLLNGPWGTPPRLDAFETVVLVAGATGMTFILPLLQAIVHRPGTVRRVVVHWAVRERAHLRWFERELHALATSSQLDLTIGVSVSSPAVVDAADSFASSSSDPSRWEESKRGSSSSSSDSSSSLSLHSAAAEPSASSPFIPATSTSSDAEKLAPLTPSISVRLNQRPDLDTIIRPAVERAYGETAVVGCGGRALMAGLRNYVAGLSDERAVHKGSGAQGIFLFTEMFEQ